MAPGPDKGRSWVVALCCCFINIMLFGVARLSGMLFVASVQHFGISRKEASFPYSLSSCIRNLSGPLVGYLGHRYGVRAVVISGSILASIGIASCFFAESITSVTILWGVVFGVGFGMGNVILPIPINQYFDKHRSTASGISFSGACLGSFILPSIVEALLDAYGLPGTFLVLAALVFNCVAAALFLTKPNFTISNSTKQITESPSSENQSELTENGAKLFMIEDNTASEMKVHGSIKTSLAYQNGDFESNVLTSSYGLEAPPIEWMIANPALSLDERVQRLSTQTLLSDYSIRLSCSEPVDFDYIMRNSKGRRTVTDAHSECDTCSVASGEATHGKVIFDDVFESSSITDSRKSSQLDNVIGDDFRSVPVIHEKSSENISTPLSNYLLHHALKLKGKEHMANQVNKNEAIHSKEQYSNMAYQSDIDENLPSQKVILNIPKKPKKSTSESFKVFLDPTFLLLGLINAFYCFTFVCMITVVVDFARDIGIESHKEKYILMSFSIGDLAGRLGLCWVTDRGYMTKCGFAALCFLCQAVSTVATVFCTGFSMLIVVMTLYGLSEAGFIVVAPLIVAQFIEEDKHTVAIPSSYLFSGPACLAVPPLIGIFREDIGSYEGIFYMIGIVSLLCSLSLLLVPSLANCRKKKE